MLDRTSIVSENVQSFINQSTPSQDFTGAPSSFASFDVVQPTPIGTPRKSSYLKLSETSTPPTATRTHANAP